MPFAALAIVQEILPINLTALLVESIESSVQGLAETAEFDQKFAAPPQSPAQITGPSSDG